MAAFINFYLTYVNDEIVDVGYFPASDDALECSQAGLAGRDGTVDRRIWRALEERWFLPSARAVAPTAVGHSKPGALLRVSAGGVGLSYAGVM